MFFNRQTFVYIFPVHQYAQEHNHHDAGGELGEKRVPVCAEHHAEYAAGKRGEQVAQLVVPHLEHDVVASPQQAARVNQQVEDDAYDARFRPYLDVGGVVGDGGGQSVAESPGFHAAQAETFAEGLVPEVFRQLLPVLFSYQIGRVFIRTERRAHTPYHVVALARVCKREEDVDAYSPHRGGAHQPDVFTDKREEQQAAQRHHDGSPGARSEHGVQ